MMTIDKSYTVTFYCENCSAMFDHVGSVNQGKAVVDAQDRARSDGWLIEPARHLCPDHSPLTWDQLGDTLKVWAKVIAEAIEGVDIETALGQKVWESADGFSGMTLSIHWTLEERSNDWDWEHAPALNDLVHAVENAIPTLLKMPANIKLTAPSVDYTEKAFCQDYRIEGRIEIQYSQDATR